MQRYFIIGIITLISIFFFSSCAIQNMNDNNQSNSSNTPEFITAKLINITGGDFTPSAQYYEGRLILSYRITGKQITIFVCSESWDWVKQDSCYRFDPNKVNENIEQHKYSAELSGCYIGSLEEVAC